MDFTTQFFQLLSPRLTGDNTFEGHSLPLDSPAIFGGQLLAQVLSAAAATLEAPRPAHYLQACFVAPGDPQGPLRFSVEITRDGRSTSHRQVAVSQSDRVLLTAAVSFQNVGEGVTHAVKKPEVDAPEELLQNKANEIIFSENPDKPFPFIIVNCPQAFADGQPESAVWARPREQVPDNELLHQILFAFFSDATILQSALAPHNIDWEDPGLFIATMNHTIWFHRPVDINDWVLLHSVSPSSGAGRAFSVANAFSRQGNLAASVAQEGILRTVSQ